ncbi:hypothetical protein FPV67DRAFT_1451687 [Lyophyllum atratum]|nr:hypothetical protein FPV67DRAFT_1451687 [Lyophyllum atratum]
MAVIRSENTELISGQATSIACEEGDEQRRGFPPSYGIGIVEDLKSPGTRRSGGGTIRKSYTGGLYSPVRDCPWRWECGWMILVNEHFPLAGQRSTSMHKHERVKVSDVPSTGMNMESSSRRNDDVLFLSNSGQSLG